MKFRLDILLFSIASFILTAIGLEIGYYRTLNLPSLWLGFIYAVVCVLVLASAANFFVEGGKLSWTQFLFLTFGAIILSGIVTHSAWTIVTPRWAFSVSTDKSTYSLGENVEITVCLKNMGFITHPFQSEASDPIIVRIRRRYSYDPIWFSPYNLEETAFSVGPNQILQRNFLWNQTGYADYVDVIPGEYGIIAEIPGNGLGGHIFWARTYINITAS